MDLPTATADSSDNRICLNDFPLAKEHKNESLTFTVFPYDLECIASNIDDQDYFSALPQEMILNIFKFLSIPNLRTCAMVSKLWHTLSFSAELWSNIVLNSMCVEVSFLERILNCNVKNIYFNEVTIKQQTSVVGPILKTSRFDSLQGFSLFYTNIKLELLEELLSSSRNLKELELEGSCDHVGSCFFRHIVKLQFLEKLVLRGIEIQNIQKIVKILKNVKKFWKLKSLVLFLEFRNSEMDEFSSQSEIFLQILLGLCPNLEVLSLIRQNINGTTFKHILGMKSLKDLNIRSTTLFSNICLSYVKGNFQKWVNLEKLNVSNTVMPPKLLPILIYLSPNLESLVIGGVITQSIFEEIMKITNLKELDFRDADLTVLNDIKSFKKFEELRILRLSGGQNFTPPLVSRILSCCENLSELIIFVLDIDDVIFRQTLEMKKLQKLALECVNIPLPFNTAKNFENHQIFEQLKSLDLSFGETKVNSIDVETILMSCKNLTYLTLGNCLITEGIFRCITFMSELENLHLFDFESDHFDNIVNDENLPKLLKLQNLEVYYRKCEFVPHLLEVLLPLCGNIQELDLYYTYLTDKICRFIASMTELKSLTFLIVYGVTNDKIAEILKGCPRLTKNNIQIHNSRIEDNDINVDMSNTEKEV